LLSIILSVSKIIELNSLWSSPFKVHQDRTTSAATDEITKNRVLTFVYYFHSPVKKFTGGNLVFPSNGGITIEPVNNSIVFFSPILWHEVLPVTCPSKEFINGRFTINGWIIKENHL
jgi:Rps23 Pro-64 3,4-dihydroxylase Tpa1-like proline 4-hydroxylase